MNSIRAIQKLNKRELEEGINPEASWHTNYRDTAFIYIGGLPFELSKRDIITIFLYCDLAVDNLRGATVMDRVLKVDHTRYKPKDDEDMRDNTMGELDGDAGKDSDSGQRKRRRTESESDLDDNRPLLPEEIELEKAIRNLDEEDPMKESLIKRLQEKADYAVKKYKKSKRKEKERERKHYGRHCLPQRNRSRDRDRERRRIKHNNSKNEDRYRRGEHRSTRGDSDDEHCHRNSRRHRDDTKPARS
ncbi:hypothetical protein BU23DRAFT_576948 [Bimuria novae-zelandiae CBS 107.79]|uniref:RRM domain-containing protein n=1 Tax=Bimuria novae-zelandiae CBS 107.79 TaxID=1447943 RepID=A0A6A5VQ00_9PLEO|nr:hypothetical protein BU23DRAFT_576948 [Bimuria novae-zelandiae CBS 107.79]